jgi:hypothetical protein
MTKQVAVPIIPGIDLAVRPRTCSASRPEYRKVLVPRGVFKERLPDKPAGS